MTKATSSRAQAMFRAERVERFGTLSGVEGLPVALTLLLLLLVLVLLLPVAVGGAEGLAEAKTGRPLISDEPATQRYTHNMQ